MAESYTRIELNFECPQPQVSWVVEEVMISERLNDPYEMKIHLRTADMNAERLKLLGQSCKLMIVRGAYVRPFMGIVSEVEEGDVSSDWQLVEITVVPALHSLKHRVDTRIFQNLSVPQILDQVLGEGLAPYERSIDNKCDMGSYPTCEYRVQYNESDFDFCERLMEEEGIAYWFEFNGEQETMVLSDAPSHFSKIQSTEGPNLLYSRFEQSTDLHETVTDFTVGSEIRSTKVSTKHFDWTHPSVPLQDTSTPGDLGEDGRQPNGVTFGPEREVYEHDDRPITLHQYSAGGGFGANDQRNQTKIRRQAYAYPGRMASGISSVVDMKTGATFTLQGHSLAEFDGSYRVLEVNHSFGGSSDRSYSNFFRCIPEAVHYRPPRVTPKPRINSMQTAIVVGPAGEEIHTDERGRIKVQFHWDRLGSLDEYSSCWIRVMQPWAGAGWGFLFIPRIDMEVIVNFVNGDVDQPVVVGSLYNGDNPPPYSLPEEKTKSTIKTQSSLGGMGYNEFRFEDKAGSEEIFTHAQKDYNEVVENDHTTTVHHDQTIVVDNDQSTTVGHDQTNTVHNNQTQVIDNCQTETVSVDQTMTVGQHRTKTVVGNETTAVQGNRTESVTGNETISIASNRSESVASNESISIGANRSVSIGAGDDLSVGGSRKMSVSGSLQENVLAIYSQSVLGAHNVIVGGLKAEEVGLSYNVVSGINYSLNAGKNITLKTGSSSITLKSDGTIEIKGVKIEINGKSLIKLHYAKIEQNC